MSENLLDEIGHAFLDQVTHLKSSYVAATCVWHDLDGQPCTSTYLFVCLTKTDLGRTVGP